MNLYQKKGEYDEMEYIAREALLEQLKAMESYNTSPMYRRGYDDCVEAILKAPAADVVPVVHGWWNATETCSLCGEKSTEGLDATTWNYWLPNYCPHCGARMDGGEDND